MFHRIKGYRLILLFTALSAFLAVTGCAGRDIYSATSTVDFLYPYIKNPEVTPGIPALSLPIRVGIAFVPSGGSYSKYNVFPVTHDKKQELIQHVADHLKKYSFVRGIEFIPSAYVKTKGSFANLEKIRTMYGVDAIALISYDQAQITDQDLLSLSYWTIAGAYVVHGEKDDTLTLLDTVVVDIESRKILFRAPGRHHIKGGATSLNRSEQLKLDSDAGFAGASKELIDNLDQQLAIFNEKINKPR